MGVWTRPLVAVVHDRLHLAFIFGAIAAEKHRDQFMREEDISLLDLVWCQGLMSVEAPRPPYASPCVPSHDTGKTVCADRAWFHVGVWTGWLDGTEKIKSGKRTRRCMEFCTTL